VNFRRALRPIYSLQSEYKRKRNNAMILHVYLFYKQNICDSNYTFISGINTFRFRSNSGRSTKPYTLKKQKVETTEDYSHNQESNDNQSNYPWDNTGENTLNSMAPFDIKNAPLENSKPLIRRIHPDQCFAFQNWDSDNPDITFILLGNNLSQVDGIKVYFVYNQLSVEAKEKKTQYTDKEYYVPCVKRLINNADIIHLPENGLTVDVILMGNNIETPPVQKYTYLNLLPATQSAFGVKYQRGEPSDIQSLPKPIPHRSSSIFYFPDLCDESEVIRHYENHRLFPQLEDQNKRNILHYAIQLDFKELTDYAIQCGANINQADEYGFTPLHMAVYHDNLPIIKLLVKHRASMKLEDANGNNPYKLAVKLKRYEIINYFLMKIILVKCKSSLKDKITPNQMSQVWNWLKSMDGKCTMYWRLQALPYLPPIARLICTAALIEKPQFLHFKAGMYYIKINRAKAMLKILFPDSSEGLFHSDENFSLGNSWPLTDQKTFDDESDDEDLELQQQFMDDFHLRKNTQKSKTQSRENIIM